MADRGNHHRVVLRWDVRVRGIGVGLERDGVWDVDLRPDRSHHNLS